MIAILTRHRPEQLNPLTHLLPVFVTTPDTDWHLRHAERLGNRHALGSTVEEIPTLSTDMNAHLCHRRWNLWRWVRDRRLDSWATLTAPRSDRSIASSRNVRDGVLEGARHRRFDHRMILAQTRLRAICRTSYSRSRSIRGVVRSLEYTAIHVFPRRLDHPTYSLVPRGCWKGNRFSIPGTANDARTPRGNVRCHLLTSSRGQDVGKLRGREIHAFEGHDRALVVPGSRPPRAPPGNESVRGASKRESKPIGRAIVGRFPCRRLECGHGS